MKSVQVKINPKVIQYYIDSKDISVADLVKDKQFKKINDWLSGNTKPTVNQLNKLSKKLEVPFGYLLLNDIQKADTSLIKYRTVLNNSVYKPSAELLDTISDMENKQDWLHDFLVRNGEAQLDFVGSCAGQDRVKIIAQKIRYVLQIKEHWFTHCNSQTAFNYLRNKCELSGVLVMQSGIVQANTHRTLDIEEFRAFVLVDNYAPLIFINSTDSKGGKIFSLFHELAHIFLGESDLFNDNHNNNQVYRNDLEVLCNNVASELCLPTHYFKDLWQKETENDKFEKIQEIASKCHISILAVAVKARKQNYLNSEEYTDIHQKSLKLYHDSKIKGHESQGGNGINNIKSRIDKRFFTLLSGDIRSGNTKYTEAYQLLNTNRSTFDKIEKKMLES